MCDWSHLNNLELHSLLQHFGFVWYFIRISGRKSGKAQNKTVMLQYLQ